MLLGSVMVQSRRAPVALSVLIGVGGAGYLVDNTLRFVAPDLQAVVNPWLVLPMMAELVLALWLLARGVRD